MEYIFCAKTIEDIRNPSLCIYDNNTDIVRNIKDEFDIIKNVIVYVDTVSKYNESENEIKEDIIKAGAYVRCRRANVIL